MGDQPAPPPDGPETGPLVAWPSAKHADRMVALVPPDLSPLPKVGDRLVLSTTGNPAEPQQYVDGLIVEPPFKIKYGPNKGQQAVIVKTSPPEPAEGRAAFVAHELLAAACHYYCAISHLAYKFWQPSLFPQYHQDLILREADQAYQRRMLALTRRQDYLADTPNGPSARLFLADRQCGYPAASSIHPPRFRVLAAGARLGNPVVRQYLL